MIYAIVRIKSTINANNAVKDTLKMLNLNRINTCTIIHNNQSYKGMLQKVKDYITWGEINDKTLTLLLKRAKVENIADALKKIKDGSKLIEITNPSIGLHPPRKGYKSIKKPYGMGGSAGFRGKDINQLIERML